MTDQELEEDYREILDWFLIQSKNFQKNAKILSAKEHGQNFMLHIDKNTPKVFVPKLQETDKKNTELRITVSDSIVGCCVGYARIPVDFFTGEDDSSVKDRYRGGYDICKLDFRHCISPNQNLIDDQPGSNEKWLVTYNSSTMKYTPKKIGKLFFTSACFTAARNKNPVKAPSYKVKGYLHHEEPQGIYLLEGKLLPPGFYELNMEFNEPGLFVKENPNNHTFTKISAGEYNQKKQLHASLLSESVPKFMGW